MKKYLKGKYLPAMLGAGIEYYDIALYGFMAPILIQVFLPHLEKSIAYFLYFFFEFIAALFQFAGARFFGRIGDKYGRKNVMYKTMLGLSIVTFFICLVPTYATHGILATIIFITLRSLQSFFLGGEYNGVAIYLLEHESDQHKHGLVSGLYCAFTVLGIVFASIIATICNKIGPEYFRAAYAISFALAVITFRVRAQIKETPEFLKFVTPTNTTPLKRRTFISIAVAILFFGIVYGLPTRIMNAILPMAGKVSSDQIMLINTVFLVIYMTLLAYFGALSDKFTPRRIMQGAAIFALFAAIPLMLAIESGVLLNIILAKAVFAIITAAFIGPFHAWAQRLYPVNARFTKISMANATGKCISTIILACSVLIFDRTGSFLSLGIILMITAVLVLIALSQTSKTSPEMQNQPDHSAQETQ